MANQPSLLELIAKSKERVPEGCADPNLSRTIAEVLAEMGVVATDNLFAQATRVGLTPCKVHCLVGLPKYGGDSWEERRRQELIQIIAAAIEIG